jgi:hypothetical protein
MIETGELYKTDTRSNGSATWYLTHTTEPTTSTEGGLF